MKTYEKLGAFYLGRTEATAEREAATLMYDAKDLTTHGVCVGMTGSGKTGLCLSLIEEAAMDGIPVLAIDPKGDLGNLLLTFPELRPEDFAPWIDPAEAARKGAAPEAYAVKVAETWRKGLAGWDQDGGRIRRMKETADFSIYTPGSTAGRPLTVLSSFKAPPPAIREDPELLAERVDSSVAGLMALLGVRGDPLQTPEYILMANLLRHEWEAGRHLDLPSILKGIQKPPFDKVGFFDLETFYPAKDRMQLAMRLNNLLASPGFASWLEGEPLDINALMYTPEGKPRITILSIAHLSESERMFFVTLLLNELVAWMRGQPGTSSLRALLYMDEIFGFFPPSGNPPSKMPMLTLLKQARAYGLGCLLATQNPVDLDYKGLANTGTWFIGRLQTERDKMRVMEGLEGASAGGKFDRARMEQILAGLGCRRFLLHNVHDEGPVVFETRWAMSYLRGPLTREQIRKLTPEPPLPSSSAPVVEAPQAVAPPSSVQTASLLPAGIQEALLPCAKPGQGRGWIPCLGGTARLHYVRASKNVDVWITRPFTVPLREGIQPVDWSEVEFLPEDTAFELPEKDFLRPELPGAVNAKNVSGWEKEAKSVLYEKQTLTLLSCPALKLDAEPGETAEQFQGRLHHLARERRDVEVEALRQKVEKKFVTLRDQIRRAEDRVERTREAHSEKKMNTALSFGSTLLGAFLGSKKMSVTNVNRTRSSLSKASKLGKSKEDIERAEDELAARTQQYADLEAQLEQDLEKIKEAYSPENLKVEELGLPFRKSDLRFEFFGLLWREV
ncbi:MAG: helicase HerA-like domain-containing protein [Kiritimatiellia bacterium]